MVEHRKAWVVAVDMGYGHQRAAHPLHHIAYERVITANSDKVVSDREKRTWDFLERSYIFFSRFKETPLIGNTVFSAYDKLQSIAPFYPFRDLSRPTFGVRYFKWLITKKGLGASLIDFARQKEIPFVTTHFIPALAGHYLGLKKIYCVITDVDINRVWVPDNPKESNITYFAPARHTVMRLKTYGVLEEKIKLTGFPLPKENLGKKSSVLKRDLCDRLPNLDPRRIFLERNKGMVRERIGRVPKARSSHPLTITYMVGGAGIQEDIGIKIANSLSRKIREGLVRLVLVAGTRLDVRLYFEKGLASTPLKAHIGRGIDILCTLDKGLYFRAFDGLLHTTDILWSKPSELSFYAGLGLPIIIAPPVGAHERYNAEWLGHIGAGFVQEDPSYTHDWLFYWLDDGRLAEAAFDAFLKAPSGGVYEIEKAVFGDK